MVIPFRHVETPFNFSVAEWTDLCEMVREAKQLLSAYRPDGFTLGWNVGAAGGQHVFHALCMLSAAMRRRTQREEVCATLYEIYQYEFRP
jgi:hypothetical protein